MEILLQIWGIRPHINFNLKFNEYETRQKKIFNVSIPKKMNKIPMNNMVKDKKSMQYHKRLASLNASKLAVTLTSAAGGTGNSSCLCGNFIAVIYTNLQ